MNLFFNGFSFALLRDGKSNSAPFDDVEFIDWFYFKDGKYNSGLML